VPFWVINEICKGVILCESRADDESN